MIKLKPKEFGFKYIGHMLMFKKEYKTIWPIIMQAFIH